ncbi:PstS family phosphate ABC transporter substrate-binding protein [Nostoc spongiaeforme FACHB-130]|uniref:PstS family phosphate ABC transporter substrate-binding protein n=1 Tax=Nostoc spongiaeforme FACHB-130 TaxID=1357510 RepID=A0ABR8FY35_9NOSO|nr:PstS family phosphate ABC transporter substrate-binding protein [Nostoc spongiaeforme]MBD2596347.1 PstS family phosphate ABC transporter substrate-binding protein [Nostoc spongiaeforme FACHB-130]
MTQQHRTNETKVLVLTLAITLGLVGGLLWWFSHSYGIKANYLNRTRVETPNTDTFSQIPDVPTGLFSYGGSTTWAPIRQQVDSAVAIVWPKFQLRYTEPIEAAPGSGTGIKMLLGNQLAFSQSSRALKPEENEEAKKLGFTLKAVPVAIDGIAIAVHPNLNLPGLTLTQLKDIYTGKVNNWEQLGGPKLPITPYSRRPEDSGTIEFFDENVLAGEKFSSNVQFIDTTTKALKEVAKNPGAIYYASAPEVVGQCSIKTLPLGKQPDKFIEPYKKPYIPLDKCPQQRNQLNTEAFQTGEYPITRRLFVIVKQNGQRDQQAGEAYANLLLTDQGQELIAKAGFVRLR